MRIFNEHPVEVGSHRGDQDTRFHDQWTKEPPNRVIKTYVNLEFRKKKIISTLSFC